MRPLGRVASMVLGLAGALTVSTAALAADPLPEVSRMVTELRYEEALERVRAVRVDPRAEPETHLRAVELEAIALLGLGDTGAARRAFEDLVGLDPGASLSDPDPSPRITELFEEVRAARPRTPRQGLVTAVVAPSMDGSPAAVTALPLGESAVVRVVFDVSSRGRLLQEIEAEPGGPPWSAEIPVASRRAAAELEVVARGYAPSGEIGLVSEVARVPVEAAPTPRPAHPRPAGAPVPRRRPRPEPGLAEKPWFWAIVGATVVVGAFVVIGVTGGGGPDRPSGSDPGAGGGGGGGEIE